MSGPEAPRRQGPGVTSGCADLQPAGADPPGPPAPAPLPRSWLATPRSARGLAGRSEPSLARVRPTHAFPRGRPPEPRPFARSLPGHAHGTPRGAGSRGRHRASPRGRHHLRGPGARPVSSASRVTSRGSAPGRGSIPTGHIAEARAVDARGRPPPLHGLPVGIKDIIDTADAPTECGTPLYRGRRPVEGRGLRGRAPGRRRCGAREDGHHRARLLRPRTHPQPTRPGAHARRLLERIRRRRGRWHGAGCPGDTDRGVDHPARGVLRRGGLQADARPALARRGASLRPVARHARRPGAGGGRRRAAPRGPRGARRATSAGAPTAHRAVAERPVASRHPGDAAPAGGGGQHARPRRRRRPRGRPAAGRRRCSSRDRR